MACVCVRVSVSVSVSVSVRVCVGSMSVFVCVLCLFRPVCLREVWRGRKKSKKGKNEQRKEKKRDSVGWAVNMKFGFEVPSEFRSWNFEVSLRRDIEDPLRKKIILSTTKSQRRMVKANGNMRHRCLKSDFEIPCWVQNNNIEVHLRTRRSNIETSNFNVRSSEHLLETPVGPEVSHQERMSLPRLVKREKQCLWNGCVRRRARCTTCHSAEADTAAMLKTNLDIVSKLR